MSNHCNVCRPSTPITSAPIASYTATYTPPAVRRHDDCAAYSERSFAETAKTVRRGGSRAVSRVGPDRTTRVAGTPSPVDTILAGRGARHVNVSLLRCFSEPGPLDGRARDLLRRGMESAVDGRHGDSRRTVGGGVETINAGLKALKAGGGVCGRIAVVVEPGLTPDGARGDR